jgi:hypothetical protein
MRRMDRSVVWRSGIVQAVAVAVVAVVLGAALPTSFFEEWGWLAGPGAWFACALLTARLVRLPWAPVLAGAALAGLPAILGEALDVHWLGAAVGVPLFALWCGRLARDRDLLREVV